VTRRGLTSAPRGRGRGGQHAPVTMRVGGRGTPSRALPSPCGGGRHAPSGAVVGSGAPVSAVVGSGAPVSAAAAMLPAHAPGARRRAVAAEGSREAHRMSVRLCGTALPADRSFRELLRWDSDPACSDGVKTNSVTVLSEGPEARRGWALNSPRYARGRHQRPTMEFDDGSSRRPAVRAGVGSVRPAISAPAPARKQKMKKRITTLITVYSAQL
jgi:hypothetical protein